MPRNVPAFLALFLAAAVLASASPNASAQDAPPEEELTPQQKATALFGEGDALEKEKDYDGAIAKYKEAYEAFADAGLFIRVGQAYQLKGNENNRDVDAYKSAIENYQKYLELVPDGDAAIAEEVNKRIAALETAIAEEEEAVKKQAEDEKQAKIAEAQAKREEEARLRKEKEALEGMRPAIDALVVTGLDQDSTLAVRLMAGGFLGWKYFGIEGHLAFESLFSLAENKGTQGRSLTVLDLGVRFGDGAENFTGFFGSAGGGFGLFSGTPRERRLEDDPSCQGAATCQFDVNKNITGRLGIGYGFSASDKTTVAARLDFTYWQFSIDDEQPIENVPAGLVDKPQQSYSLLVGLEFMRWL